MKTLSNHNSPRLGQQCKLLVGAAFFVCVIIIILQFQGTSSPGGVGNAVSPSFNPSQGVRELQFQHAQLDDTRDRQSSIFKFLSKSTPVGGGGVVMHIDNINQVVDHYRLDKKRVFTTLTTATYCFNVLVLYKSLLRVDLKDEYALVVFHMEPMSKMLEIAECRVLHQNEPKCLFVQVPDILLPSWSTPQNFGRMAMNKFAVFLFPAKMGRVVHLDGDVALVQDPRSLFEIEESTHIAACVDQWDGCGRRDVYNTGILSVTPRRFIYDALVQRVQFTSCLSETWQWAEQEDVNCICGGAGRPKPESRDIKCKLLPEIYGAYPGVSEQCGVPAKDIIIFHYAGPFEKPPFDHLKSDPNKMEMTRNFWLCLYEERSLILNERVVDRLRKQCHHIPPT